MTSQVKRILLGLVLLASAWRQPAAALADERPRLQVRFELLELVYRLAFTDEEIVALEDAAGTVLARKLGCEYPFFDFVVEERLAEEGPPAGTPQNRVTVRLGEEAPATNVRPVHFHVTLAGPDVVGAVEPSPVLFRKQEQALDATGSWEDFLQEIEQSFKENFDRAKLGREQFRWVKLTERAFPLSENDSWFWILPFSQDDLGIAIEGSVFRVTADLHLPGVLRRLEHHANAYGLCLEREEVPPEFHHKLMARFGDDPDKLADLKSSERQENLEIRVEVSEPMLREALSAASPTSLLSPRKPECDLEEVTP